MTEPNIQRCENEKAVIDLNWHDKSCNLYTLFFFNSITTPGVNRLAKAQAVPHEIETKKKNRVESAAIFIFLNSLLQSSYNLKSVQHSSVILCLLKAREHFLPHPHNHMSPWICKEQRASGLVTVYATGRPCDVSYPPFFCSTWGCVLSHPSCLQQRLWFASCTEHEFKLK